MSGLDPRLLGWHEFWLRILVLACAVTVAMLIVTIVVKLLLHLWDAACWVVQKVGGGAVVEPYGAPLKLALQANRGRAVMAAACPPNAREAAPEGRPTP